jgi:hypothetical protein
VVEKEPEAEEEVEFVLELEDLREPFMKMVQTSQEPLMGRKNMIAAYFNAVRNEDPVLLARYLGRERLESIKRLKEKSLYGRR